MAETERFGLASHLYVRLRRTHTRVVDVAWMAQNDEYAREILRISKDHPDPEVTALVKRFEELLGIASTPVAAAPVTAGPAADAPKPKPKPSAALENEVAQHYTGALR